MMTPPGVNIQHCVPIDKPPVAKTQKLVDRSQKRWHLVRDFAPNEGHRVWQVIVEGRPLRDWK
jgi:hypothetical protein